MNEATRAKLDALRARLRTIHDLRTTGRLLIWDQATKMPRGGAVGRSGQLATIGRLEHEHQVDPELGRLLDELRPLADSLPEGDLTRALIEVSRRDYDRARRVAPEFVEAFMAHQAETFELWQVARPADDFALVRPNLERTLDFSRRLAGFFAPAAHLADPLIDESDPGLTVAIIRPLFETLRRRLSPLVDAVCRMPEPDDQMLHQLYPERLQLEFGVAVIRQIGYDFGRGRQDRSRHPFMIRIGSGDIRITTRVQEHDITDALFGTIHEAGHALYEQGVAEDLEGTPLGMGASFSVHESQSRLWENIVGRSLGFWRHFYPILQEWFPSELDAVALDTFHRAINGVKRSLIRTDADELTYTLHILHRFELELDLLEGRLEVADLPEAWSDRLDDLVGIRAPHDRDGVLQDVHWFGGPIGGQFHGYALGNIMSAQFYDAALADRSDIPAQIEEGRFDGLLGWLREHVHRFGRSFAPLDLVERATGQPLSVEPYLRYLTEKYGRLYGLGDAIPSESGQA